jgi:eukaryotic-like serine/threonine-protein kinase
LNEIEQGAEAVKGPEFPETLSLTAQLCDSFKQAIERGESPRIEEYVNVAGTSARHVLVELVILELQHRILRGEAATAGEYLNRYSELQDDSVAQKIHAVETAATALRRNVISLDATVLATDPVGTGGQGQTADAGEDTTNFGDPDATAAFNATLPLESAQRARPAIASATRFHILRSHARGGLGEVFVAHDAELGREVALKEIQALHADDNTSRTRFAREARITGRLEHPGIVPVYSLGTHNDGRPYYAMRFISGESFRTQLKRFHKEHPVKNASFFYSRSLQRLLRRFIDVCNTIHYAHERNVLHRDIKPDNVMLGEFGETVVVDWGLAKLLGGVDAEPDAPHDHTMAMSETVEDTQTQQGAIIGTLAYMSPEQAQGRADLTRSADIYSLGATLLAILTGQSPVTVSSLMETLHRISSGNVNRVCDLVPHAPKALDSICRKAMALLPEDRYASARELADDVELWLADEPVEAHRQHETYAERAGRIMRRYRNWTFSIAFAVLAVSAIAVVALVLINRARVLEQLAKEEASDYRIQAIDRYRLSREAVDTFLVGANESLAQFPATQSLRKRMLEMAAQHYSMLSNERSRDSELELERGRALVRLGDILQMQTNGIAAREHYQRAIRSFTDSELNAETPFVQRLRLEKAYARSRIALAWDFEDQLEHAAENYAAATNELRTLLSLPDAPYVEKATRYLAAVITNHAELLRRHGKSEQAVPMLQEGVDLWATASGVDPAKIEMNAAKTSELLGRTLRDLGRYAEAEAAFSKAITKLRDLVEQFPDQPDYLDALASALTSRAANDRLQGRWQQEREALQNAADFYQTLRKSFPDDPRYQESVALTLVNSGLMHLTANHSDLALEPLAAARKMYEELIIFYGALPTYREGLGAAADGWGQALLDLYEDASAAIPAFDEATRVYFELASASPEQTLYFERLAVATSHFARALARIGKVDESRDKFGEAIELLELLVEKYPAVPAFRSQLALVHEEAGRQEVKADEAAAERHYRVAGETWHQLFAESKAAEHGYQLASHLASCPYTPLRNPDEALAIAKETADLAPNNPMVLATLATCYLNAGDSDAAARYLEAAEKQQDASEALTGCIRARLSHQRGDSHQAAVAWEAAEQWVQLHRPFNEEARQLLQETKVLLEGRN